jgi:thymidylate synthase ThyX
MDKARMLADLEVHKQYANRILEPFAHITVVCSATDFANFFALRCHPMAQPEIHALADLMYEAYRTSQPEFLKDGFWHLPFVDEKCMQEVKDHFGVSCLQDSDDAINMAIKRSVARCARVSYLNHDGTSTSIEDDLKLYDRLLGSSPIHASPAEHQAQAGILAEDSRSGNFRGWLQFRKTLDRENIEEFELPEES